MDHFMKRQQFILDSIEVRSNLVRLLRLLKVFGKTVEV
jgi:hypothetical protein